MVTPDANALGIRTQIPLAIIVSIKSHTAVLSNTQPQTLALLPIIKHF
jgi:hypothetical protein